MRLFTEYHSLSFSAIADLINAENSLNTRLKRVEEDSANHIKNYHSPQGEFENRKMYAEKIRKWKEHHEKGTEAFRKSTEQEFKKLRQRREEIKKSYINQLKQIKCLHGDYYSVKYNAEEEIANVSIISPSVSGLRNYKYEAVFTFNGTASIPIERARSVITGLRLGDSAYITCSFKKNTGGQTTRDDFKYGWEICDLKIVVEGHNESFPIR